MSKKREVDITRQVAKAQKLEAAAERAQCPEFKTILRQKAAAIRNTYLKGNKMPGLAITILLILLGACSTEQQEFIAAVNKDRAAGATWHYVGPRDTDPKAQAVPLRCIDPETGQVCDKPFILWKLKK